MQEVKIKLYDIYELKESFPKSFARVLDRWKNGYDAYIPWTEEIFDSLNKLFEKAGVKLTDYNVGYPGTYIRFSFPNEEVENFTYGRAMSWLENNLFGQCRIDWWKHNPKRKTCKWYGQWPDEIKCCPFTGYCCDEDFIDSLRESIRSGKTLRSAFAKLIHVAEKLYNNEYENYYSEEYMMDQYSGNDTLFDKDGMEFDHKYEN